MSAIGAAGAGGGAAGLQQILALHQQIVDRSSLLQSLRAPDGAQPAGGANPPGGFASALTGALNSVNATQQKSEALSVAYERGDEVDIAKVMLARQEAGVAFEATLQVRNKLLSAYQDIMRTGV